MSPSLHISLTRGGAVLWVRVFPLHATIRPDDLPVDVLHALGDMPPRLERDASGRTVVALSPSARARAAGAIELDSVGPSRTFVMDQDAVLLAPATSGFVAVRVLGAPWVTSDDGSRRTRAVTGASLFIVTAAVVALTHLVPAAPPLPAARPSPSGQESLRSALHKAATRAEAQLKRQERAPRTASPPVAPTASASVPSGLRGCGQRGRSLGDVPDSCVPLMPGRSFPAPESPWIRTRVTAFDTMSIDEEAFSSDIVRKVTRRKENEVRFCVASALRGTAIPASPLSFEIEIRALITPDGIVAGATVWPRDAPGADCLRARAVRWRYPEPRGARPVNVLLQYTIDVHAE